MKGTALWLGLLGLAVMVPQRAECKEPTASKADVQQCIASSDSVQDARRQGKLLQARDAVAGCMDAKCPAMIRTDCDGYSKQVEAALPSVLLRVVDKNGGDVPSAKVTVDGKPVALDGRSLDLDPGSHKVSASADGFDEATSEIVVQEGVKNRAVDLHLTKPGQAVDVNQPPPTLTKPSKSPSTGTWIATGVLGGVAVAGLSIFAGMGLSGNSRYGDLEDSCGGHCAKSDVDSLRTRYVVADVGLIVGVVGALAAGAVVIWGPRKQTETHTTAHR